MVPSKYNLILSLVSHGQGDLIINLLSDLERLDIASRKSTLLIVTLNIPEDEAFLQNYSGEIKIIKNKDPKGFGANHNNAFKLFSSEYFIILNPDLRLLNLSLEEVIDLTKKYQAIIAPLVLSSKQVTEDSFRDFPTITNMIARIFLPKPDFNNKINNDKEYLIVDWVAGLFMSFPSRVFQKLNGFDERYFMYLEDADLCRRASLKNIKTLLVTKHKITHEAQRRTLKSINHFMWHLRSFIRFFFNI